MVNRKKTILRILDGLLAAVSAGIFITACFHGSGPLPWIVCSMSGILCVVSVCLLFYPLKSENGLHRKESRSRHTGNITELALLNDEGQAIAFWDMYGKSSLVIGLDTGENHVDVNLIHTLYASMLEVEHAVLNYSGGKWYVEDLGSQNGISILKSDGRLYKLTAAKPCLVEQGDVLCLSLTKLKLC